MKNVIAMLLPVNVGMKKGKAINEIVDEPKGQGLYVKDGVAHKFFAVTIDIKIGDEIVGLDGNSIGKCDKIDKKGKIWIGDFYDKAHRLFKILGKISPYATWVKDGLEIEILSKLVVNKGEEYLLVKCPTCNTYH